VTQTQAYPEQVAMDANAQLLALLDATVDAMIIINYQGQIEVFNNAATQMFGYQLDEVVGKNVSMLMPAPYKRAHDGYLEHYVRTKQAKIIGIGREVQGQKKNGELFPIELSVGEVKQASHQQFVGIIRDISERVKVQADLAQSRQRLAQFTRLSTIGEMAAGIAHEINQPLTAITSYAQACRNFIGQNHQNIQDPSMVKVNDALDKISAQTHRASEVIKRLRSFVKKGHVTRKSVALDQLIHSTIRLAEADTRLLEHGVTLQLIADTLPELNIDGIQIQQVLFNLIDNAIDAMQGCPSKPIEIRCRWLDDKHIEISVADFGIGVACQYQDNLFQPFYTTKNSGMGIGLSISQTIVEAHGGKMAYCQRKPTGSIFAFTLPAVKRNLSKSK
jgi:two-component system sensor kinase FixL